MMKKVRNGIKYLLVAAGLLIVVLSWANSGIASNLIPEDSSFETEKIVYMALGSEPPIETAIDPYTSIDGGNSLKLRFAGGAFTRPRGKSVSTTPGKTYTFSLYAKGERNGVNASLRLVSTRWWGEPLDAKTKNIILNKEWKRYSLSITAKEEKYWLGFQINEPGIAWIDAVQLEEGKLTQYKNTKQESFGILCPLSYHHLFLSGEKIPINICYYNNRTEFGNKGLKISYQISDFYGKIVKQGENLKFNVDKDGRFKKSLSFKPEKLGLFTCRSQIKKDGVLLRDALTTFAVVKHPVKIKEGIEPFCGIDSRRMPAGISEKLNFPWMEALIHWGYVEPEKGKFNWAGTYCDRIFDFKKRGFKVKVIIWGSPEWSWDEKELAECKAKGIAPCTSASPGLLPNLKDWRDFVRAAVTRYKDAVDIWELWGEVELTMGRHNAYYRYKYPDAVKGKFVCGPVTDRYAEMIKVATKEIKSIIPDAKIGAIRPCNVDIGTNFTFSREVFKKSGKDFDVFPLDPYCSPWIIGPFLPESGTPEKLFDTFEKAFALIKEYGNNQHIYISEIGWKLDRSVAPDSAYAKEHASKLAKTYLVSKMTKGVDLCQWLGLKDSGAGDGAVCFWRPQGYPLPAVPAYSTVSRVVENVIESKRIDLGSDIVAAVFKKPDSADACIWIKGEKAKVTILTSPRSISIFDVVGNPAKTEIKGKEITFEVGELPVYLSKKGKRAFNQLCQALSSAKLQITPARVSFNITSIDRGNLYIKNRTSQKLLANISLYLPDNKVLTKNNIEIPLSIKRPVKFILPASLIENEGEKIRVEIDCHGFEKVITSVPLEWKTCKKISFPVKIDGDLSEWSSHPYILMDKREQIRPVHQVNWSGVEDLSAKVYIGWDKESFYLAGEVMDDKHFNNKEGPMIWNGDCIQFAFDPRLNAFQKKEGGFDSDDYNLGLALAKEVPSSYLWNGSDKELWKKGEFAVVRDENKKKTFYEARIPFSSLRIFPEKDRTLFGFSFAILDDDEGAGQTYYYRLSQGIVSGQYPRYFKRFVLVE